MYREQTETWVQVKNTLKKNFGDKQIVVEIMDKLKTTTLNDNIEYYFYLIQKLPNARRIVNRKMTHNEKDYSTEISCKLD